MADKTFKRLRRAARKEKNKIVSQFMTNNWDTVLVSAVKIIRRFKFKNRLSIALTIIFKPLKPENNEVQTTRKSQEAQPEAGGAA